MDLILGQLDLLFKGLDAGSHVPTGEQDSSSWGTFLSVSTFKMCFYFHWSRHWHIEEYLIFNFLQNSRWYVIWWSMAANLHGGRLLPGAVPEGSGSRVFVKAWKIPSWEGSNWLKAMPRYAYEKDPVMLLPRSLHFFFFFFELDSAA